MTNERLTGELSFKQLQRLVFYAYKEKGFERWFNGNPDPVMASVCEAGLIGSEVGELQEAIRKGKTLDEVAEECADIVIRVFNFCNRLDIPLERAIIKKDGINRDRPFRHGDKS